MIDYTGLGKRIRSGRKAIRLTQEALAEKVGISLSFLGHIERGSRKASIDTLVGLANVLDLSLDDLLQDSLTTTAKARVGEGVPENQRNLLWEINKLIEANRDKWST